MRLFVFGYGYLFSFKINYLYQNNGISCLNICERYFYSFYSDYKMTSESQF